MLIIFLSRINESKNTLFFQANFAKWEPWHGKFGFSYPWQKYLKIGEIIRELAALILALERCFQASKKVAVYFTCSPNLNIFLDTSNTSNFTISMSQIFFFVFCFRYLP
jgi:hypothetical protein